MPYSQEQIDSLLQRPSEGLQVEHKTWLDPREDAGAAKLVSAMFAIRNRDGGFVVVGLNNETHEPDRYDLKSPVESLFHIDQIQGLVSRYANTSFPVEVVFGTLSDQRHPVIVIPEGVRTPVVVKRDLVGNGGRKLLTLGDLWFRTLSSNGTPSSARILPSDYDNLLEICFNNREADIGRFFRRHLSESQANAILRVFDVAEAAESDGLGIAEYLAHAITRGVPARPAPPNLKSRAEAMVVSGEARFQRAAAGRNEVELPAVNEMLTLRAALALEPKRDGALPTEEFMNRISSGNPRYTGWPVWLDSRGFRNPANRPYVSDDAWEALIVDLNSDWSKHLEFLRYSAEGELFLRRITQDDLSNKVTARTVLDPILMTYRVAEVIAVGLSLAKSLGWSEEDSAGFAFDWSGVGGRQLSGWANPSRWIADWRSSRADAAASYTSMPVGTPALSLAPYVSAAVAPLFVLFDGFELSDAVIEDLVRKLVERRID